MLGEINATENLEEKAFVTSCANNKKEVPVLPCQKWEKRFLFYVTADSTPVPNLLLKYFRYLGLSESELVFLIQLLMFGGKGCPPVKELSESLHMEEAVVKQNLALLIEKGIIIPESVIESGNIRVPRYFLDGLYDKLMEIWAWEMVGNSEVAAAEPIDSPVRDQKFAQVFRTFEEEFGRPLSPMETDKIIEWLDKLQYGSDVVLESLKRAVLRGVYNFNYIDKILLDWHKSNVRTVDEAINHEKAKMIKEKPGRRKSLPPKTPNLKSLYEL
jgi:DNA replication protein